MKKNLLNQVILITGASTGLGEQLVYCAAQRGATIVACARNQARLSQVIKRAHQLSGRPAFSYAVDLSDPEQIEQLVATVTKKVGPITVLINNAGIGQFENALDIKLSIMEKMFRVNTLGAIYLTQLVALQMVAYHQGTIINVASQAGKIATPKASVYAASKAALIAYSNSLRLELRPRNIWVTTVNPGPMATDFIKKADRSGKYAQSVAKIMLDPERFARRIIASIGRGTREINAPAPMEVAARLYPLFPELGDWLVSRPVFNRK
ncbi:SDR family NAD(P)-dependent oxidoreductase [Loigolactobacillus iwatensis]|uniref:SDR family NAD(P)-dependent oxidoreductase n=1 Tax=Loigolactobacillus iwatensis TaxID=1267156 RepID=UPI000F7F158E|nr:SDR family oxidoreductase [Loigolactobacillus iwatensis]